MVKYKIKKEVKVKKEPVDTYLDNGFLVTVFTDGSIRKTRLS